MHWPWYPKMCCSLWPLLAEWLSIPVGQESAFFWSIVCPQNLVPGSSCTNYYALHKAASPRGWECCNVASSRLAKTKGLSLPSPSQFKQSGLVEALPGITQCLVLQWLKKQKFNWLNLRKPLKLSLSFFINEVLWMLSLWDNCEVQIKIEKAL